MKTLSISELRKELSAATLAEELEITNNGTRVGYFVPIRQYGQLVVLLESLKDGVEGFKKLYEEDRKREYEVKPLVSEPQEQPRLTRCRVCYALTEDIARKVIYDFEEQNMVVCDTCYKKMEKPHEEAN